MSDRGPRDGAPTPPPDGGLGGTPMPPLAQSECLQLLRGASLGRLAFVVGGWPVVVPVNYAVEGETIVFRTDPGSKLEAVSHSPRVALEVDSFDPLYESGWSVLAQGVAEEVGPEERDRLAARLAVRPWAGGAKSHWVRVPILQVSGRRLPRAWAYPGPLPGR